MEATYCIGSDMDVCRMFDQYLYKRSENIDVSLSVPSHLQNGFSNMNEQNFHTPSFGDEDFDIPPINPHHNSGQQHNMGYHQPPISMANMSQTTMTMSDQNNSYHQPLYLSPPQEHNMGMGMNNYNQQNGYRMPQNSLQQLQQYSMGPPQTMRSPQGRQAQSPQTTNMPHENTTTSDDSDDSTPHSHLVAGMKRPSPEPAENTLAKIQKKPKTQKKKKKRDPNEPQKPVSAYALFFRDTQAAIKGQNPNASFGEVSKIVASMWDALDAEHKNVYKKKTEAAKKDYLKALAAYRASLVSKGGGEPEAIYGGYGGYGGGGGGGGGPYNGYSPPTGLPSPPISAPSPQSHIKKPHLMSDNRQPQPTMQQVMMGHMGQQQPQQQHMQQQTQQQPQQQQQQQQQPPQQQQQQQPQQQPQQQHSPQNPQQVNQNSNYMQQQQDGGSGPPGDQQPMSEQPPPQTPTNHCIRSGCPNSAVANSEWEDEYCSNECVVSHCKDVFSSWVASNQNSAVK